jgi:hypothetical protein
MLPLVYQFALVSVYVPGVRSLKHGFYSIRKRRKTKERRNEVRNTTLTADAGNRQFTGVRSFQAVTARP